MRFVKTVMEGVLSLMNDIERIFNLIREHGG